MCGGDDGGPRKVSDALEDNRALPIATRHMRRRSRYCFHRSGAPPTVRPQSRPLLQARRQREPAPGAIAATQEARDWSTMDCISGVAYGTMITVV